MTDLTTLHRLLDEAAHFPPEYERGLSNHLPMALAAQAGLGASEAQMRRFFAHYSGHFKDTPARLATEARPLAAWPDHRGHFEDFERLRATFAEAIAREGREAALRTALPHLVDGVGAAAFHGLIRTAHGFISRHDGELAMGLAYWAARWMPLAPPAVCGVAFDSVAEWLDALDALVLSCDSGWHSPARTISRRMQEAVHTQAYQRLAGCAPAGAVLVDLAHAAAERYARTGNFTVLHMVTATQAALTLAEFVPSDAAALAPLWLAVAAASLASRVATMPASELATPELEWPEVRALALASDDDHVIKLVHALLVRHEGAPDPVWLRAARRALRGSA
jgi:hypothetical protein